MPRDVTEPTPASASRELSAGYCLVDANERSKTRAAACLRPFHLAGIGVRAAFMRHQHRNESVANGAVTNNFLLFFSGFDGEREARERAVTAVDGGYETEIERN